MDPQPPVPPESTPDRFTVAEPAPRRISRRATLIGSLIAILVVAGIGWLAWD